MSGPVNRISVSHGQLHAVWAHLNRRRWLPFKPALTEGKPEREHDAVDGEPDGDMEGYEDEPEEDYCEGDDDGYDCD